MTSGRRAAVVGAVLASGAILAIPADGQPMDHPSEPGAADGWTVEASAFTDLWYHGLAVVGFFGSGTNPLYDVAYGRRAAQARPAGPLVAARDELLTALRGDPAFEVLHFVPVYLAGMGPLEALEGLRLVAGTPAGGRLPGAEALPEGIRLIAALLPESGQREVLGRWVALLDAERRDGAGEELGASRRAQQTRLVALEERWSTAFEPALSPYLSEHGLQGGRMIFTPTLGLEGRFFQGRPDDSRDNVVILGLDTRDGSADAALAPVVRELCFPAVRRAFEGLADRYGDRASASRASDAAATRCGELLLEARLPDALDEYRKRFGLQGSLSSAWSSLPDPNERMAWEAALKHALNLEGGS